MAKRKKRSSDKPAPDNLTPFLDTPESAEEDFHNEKAKMLSLIAKKIGSSDMSHEEAEAFLSEFAGRKMEDIIEALDEMPRSELDQANDILWDLPEGASTAEMESAAKQALAISKDCMEAWLTLSQLANTEEEAISILEKGIAHGRELHADLIESVGEEHGLWGYIEARGFMRLYHELATARQALDDLPGAVEIYEEMIRLNPGDNQGVRVPLLHHLITLNREPEVKALLKRYQDIIAHDAGMAYGKALFDIFCVLESWDERQRENFGEIPPQDLKDFRKFFGPAFPAIEKATKKAMAANPYIPLLIGLPGIMDLETPEMIGVGGPSEAVEYIQDYGALWAAIPVPFMLLNSFAEIIRLKKNRGHRELKEFGDILAAGNLPGITPWWIEMLEDSEE